MTVKEIILIIEKDKMEAQDLINRCPIERLDSTNFKVLKALVSYMDGLLAQIEKE